MNTPPRADAILVVNDDADSRAMLVEYLEDKGFSVHAAPTGETALALADTLRPRVILMDLSMPNLDGLETTASLESELKHARCDDCHGDGPRVYRRPQCGASRRLCFLYPETVRHAHGRHVSRRPDGYATPERRATPAELSDAVTADVCPRGVIVGHSPNTAARFLRRFDPDDRTFAPRIRHWLSPRSRSCGKGATFSVNWPRSS
jgi:hypothetical protein